MTEIVISPPLPAWVTETFEGQFLTAWIGRRDAGVGFVEYSGDTENEANEDIILLRMNAEEIAAFAQLGEDAGTPVTSKIAALLRDPEGTEVMNEHFGKIDITAIRIEAGLTDENGKNRMLEPDDLLHSLVSRFPEQIPYAEVRWARGATFITPAGVEWFDNHALQAQRVTEYHASRTTIATP